MPTPFVEKLAKKKGMSVTEAEERWSKAKRAAQDEGRGQDWAYVTSIFKSMMGEEARYNEPEGKSFLELEGLAPAAKDSIEGEHGFNEEDLYSGTPLEINSSILARVQARLSKN